MTSPAHAPERGYPTLPGDDAIAVIAYGRREQGTGPGRTLLAELAAEVVPVSAGSKPYGYFVAEAAMAGHTALAADAGTVGPTIVLDPERSPDLLPLVLAWQSVRLGECDTAVAAVHHAAAILVVVKRLPKAIDDGDTVFGLIDAAFGTMPSRIDNVQSSPSERPRLGLAQLIDELGRPWPARAPARPVHSRASDGTVSRVVLTAPPASNAPPGPAPEPVVIPVSAPTRAELAARLVACRDRARAAADPAAGPSDLAAALTATANQHEHRAAVIATSYLDLAARLDAAIAEDPPAADLPPGERGLVFVFAGQGHQWVGMGRELLQHEPTFRAAVDDCQAAVARYADVSVSEQLELDGPRSRMNEIDVLQPVLFTVQVALARLWADWGVRPDAVVGHSMGEISAAHVAGALSLNDAAMIVCRRSRLLRRISGLGALAVIEAGPDEAAALAADTGNRVSVAGFNSPVLSVLAGDTDSLAGIVKRLEGQDVYCKLIRGTVASHSPYVDGLREDLDLALRDLRPQSAAVPMYSTVSLKRLAGPELASPYWMRNLREPVRFAEAVTVLREAGHSVFLEISGHPVLSASVSTCLEHGGYTGRALHSGRRGTERESMLASLAALYELGWHPDWSRVYQETDGRTVTPPTAQASAAPPPRQTSVILTAYQAALAEAVLNRSRSGTDAAQI